MESNVVYLNCDSGGMLDTLSSEIGEKRTPVSAGNAGTGVYLAESIQEKEFSLANKIILTYARCDGNNKGLTANRMFNAILV